jgi:hypothetical protein
MKLNLYKVLDISTKHITHPDALKLRTDAWENRDTNEPDPFVNVRVPGPIVYGYKHGYFVYCFDDPDNPEILTDTIDRLLGRCYGEDLINIVKFAARQGCKFVNVDQDGPVYEEFPQHDW